MGNERQTRQRSSSRRKGLGSQVDESLSGPVADYPTNGEELYSFLDGLPDFLLNMNPNPMVNNLTNNTNSHMASPSVMQMPGVSSHHQNLSLSYSSSAPGPMTKFGFGGHQDNSSSSSIAKTNNRHGREISPAFDGHSNSIDYSYAKAVSVRSLESGTNPSGSGSSHVDFDLDDDVGEVINQKDLFHLYPDLKKEYSKESSRKSRAKKKREKDDLLDRNRFLAVEQDVLKQEVMKLKNELDELERAEMDRTKLVIENQMLQHQIKKRRLLMGRISSLFEKIPKEEIDDFSAQQFNLDTEEHDMALDRPAVSKGDLATFKLRNDPLLRLTEVGASACVKETLRSLASAVTNVNGVWDSELIPLQEFMPYIAKFKSENSDFELFDTLKSVNTRLQILPDGCSLQTATHINFRVDLKGINRGETQLALLLKKTLSLDSEKISYHNQVSYLHKHLFGSRVKFTELDFDFEKMSLEERKETYPDKVESKALPKSGSNNGLVEQSDYDKNYSRSREWLLAGNKEIKLSSVRHETLYGWNSRLCITSFGQETLNHHGYSGKDVDISTVGDRPIPYITSSSVEVDKFGDFGAGKVSTNIKAEQGSVGGTSVSFEGAVDEAFVVVANEDDPSLSNLTIIGRKNVDLHAMNHLFRQTNYSPVLSVKEQANALGVSKSNMKKYVIFWLETMAQAESS